MMQSTWPTAGAPHPGNKTYFCDAATATCYSLAATPRNYTQHKDYCASTLNGALVAYGSREKQMLVGGTGRLARPQQQVAHACHSGSAAAGGV